MKYDLVGIDGNAFSVMVYVLKAMKECGCNKVDQAIYVEKAKSGDYNHLLCVSMKVIEECNKKIEGSEWNILHTEKQEEA